MSIDEFVQNMCGKAMYARMKYNALFPHLDTSKKSTMLRTFLIQCEHAYVIRKARLEEELRGHHGLN